MADEQKTTTPDRTTYTSLNLGRESVDRHPSQQPETLYSSPAQRAALLRTCGGAAILLGIVISLVASAAMVAIQLEAAGRGDPEELWQRVEQCIRVQIREGLEKRGRLGVTLRHLAFTTAGL